ncbi:MAG: DUF1854 domain-containing protein [Eubacterium sp.]|nr:DUF1854 domain-containing protein [Eubacterium sp.]
MKQNTETVYEIDTLKLLDPKTVEFIPEASGLLTLKYEGEEWNRVTLTRLVPFDSTDEYVSATYKNEREEWKEIGVLKNVSDLPDDQRQIVEEFLNFKYYIPIITKIKKITDNRMGYLFLQAETTAGEKRIAVNDWWHNFRMIQNKMISVTDADGNRYLIPEISKMDKASIKKLQLFI